MDHQASFGMTVASMCSNDDRSEVRKELFNASSICNDEVDIGSICAQSCNLNLIIGYATLE